MIKRKSKSKTVSLWKDNRLNLFFCFFFFTGKYTDDYVAYPGQFINVYASAVIQNVNSADICAYQCSQNDSCKSFEYCANKMCYLKTEHILHIPPVLVASSLTCSHYSSKYY